jgi:hypothetical protein
MDGFVYNRTGTIFFGKSPPVTPLPRPEIRDLFRENPGRICARERWACIPHGRLRFSRIMENGIIELGRNGEPIVSA